MLHGTEIGSNRSPLPALFQRQDTDQHENNRDENRYQPVVSLDVQWDREDCLQRSRLGTIDAKQDLPELKRIALTAIDAAGTNTKLRIAAYFITVLSIQEATATLLEVSANRRARKLLTFLFFWMFNRVLTYIT